MSRCIKKAYKLMLFYLIAYSAVETFLFFAPLSFLDKVQIFLGKIMEFVSNLTGKRLSTERIQLSMEKIGSFQANYILHQIIAIAMLIMGTYFLICFLRELPNGLKKFFRNKDSVHILVSDKENVVLREKQKERQLFLASAVTFFLAAFFSLYYVQISSAILLLVTQYH